MTEISLSEFANRPKPKHQTPSLPTPAVLAVAALVLLGGGFLAGMQYQKSKTSSTSTAQTASTSRQYGGQYSGGGGFQRGDRAIGTVSAISSSSITIQNSRTGATDTYNITSSTAIMDSGQAVTVNDIQTGDTVLLTLNSSNTQNVDSIMVNPSFGGGFGGGGSSSGTSGPDTSGTGINAVGS